MLSTIKFTLSFDNVIIEIENWRDYFVQHNSDAFRGSVILKCTWGVGVNLDLLFNSN